MKKILTIAAAVLVVTVAEGATVLEMSRNGIDLKVDADRTQIDPARSVFLRVELKAPPDRTAALPDLRDRVVGFSVVEDFAEDPKAQKDGSSVLSANWRLVPEPCADRYKIRPFVVKASPKMMSYQSDEGKYSFVAGPVKFDPPAAREPVTGGIETDPKKDLPPLSWKLVGWISAALVALASAVAAVFFLVRYIARRVKEHRMSPIERAWAELDRLLKKGLPGRGRYKDFYVELTMVVRRYVQRQHGVRAPHLTTEEFFEAARKSPTFPQGALDELIDFLRKSDMVKFAGVEATPDTADAATHSARTYITKDDDVVRRRTSRMKASVLALLVFAASPGFGQTEAPQTDGEAWNEGVGLYRAGDVTNALRVLRPLMLSKTHGARAAEVVAKLEYDRGDLEEAANAAQIALRGSPDDAKANRNFTRAVDGLPKLRESRRIEAVLKASQGRDPGAIMLAATADARDLMSQAGTFRTNAPAAAVALADALSRRADKVAKAWIPVREAIVQSVTNEEQASTIILQIEQAEAKTKKAAEEFADMDDGAYATMSDVEHDFTRFLKLTALPPAAIAEDEAAQSNAWQDVEAFNGRSWQQDALDYTRAFRAKFPAWARAYEQQAQADTNKPPFTAEDQAKISALATELEKLQLECTEKALPPSQEKSLDIIRQIRELMPKDNSGGQGRQNQQNQQNQQQSQDRQQQQDKDQGQDKDQQPDQKQDQDPQQQDEQKEAEEKEQEQQDQKDDKEVEALLKKAQERNDEHEADKKARMRKAPLPPNERDW